MSKQIRLISSKLHFNRIIITGRQLYDGASGRYSRNFCLTIDHSRLADITAASCGAAQLTLGAIARILRAGGASAVGQDAWPAVDDVRAAVGLRDGLFVLHWKSKWKQVNFAMEIMEKKLLLIYEHQIIVHRFSIWSWDPLTMKTTLLTVQIPTEGGVAGCHRRVLRSDGWVKDDGSTLPCDQRHENNHGTHQDRQEIGHHFCRNNLVTAVLRNMYSSNWTNGN